MCSVIHRFLAEAFQVGGSKSLTASFIKREIDGHFSVPKVVREIGIIGDIHCHETKDQVLLKFDGFEEGARVKVQVILPLGSTKDSQKSPLRHIYQSTTTIKTTNAGFSDDRPVTKFCNKTLGLFTRRTANDADFCLKYHVPYFVCDEELRNEMKEGKNLEWVKRN